MARVTSSVDPRATMFCGDRGDLRGRFAQAQHDFRKPLTNRAVVIDARKAKVFERLRAQCVEEPALGVGDISLPARDGVE